MTKYRFLDFITSIFLTGVILLCFPSCSSDLEQFVEGRWVHYEQDYDEVWEFYSDGSERYIYANNDELPTIYEGRYEISNKGKSLEITIERVSEDGGKTWHESIRISKIVFDLSVDEEEESITVNKIDYQREDSDFEDSSLRGLWTDKRDNYDFYSELSFVDSTYTETFYDSTEPTHIYEGTYRIADGHLYLKLSRFTEDNGQTWYEWSGPESVYDFYMYSSDKFTTNFNMDGSSITCTYLQIPPH